MGREPDLKSLADLRRELHKYPELSGSEDMTSRKICGVLKKLQPDALITNIGGKGLAARFSGAKPGPRVMVRAELDALPIFELNNFDHRSTVPGVSHKCGHDGHMAIAAGVAGSFAEERPERGEFIVLFQPSEENGQGAYKVINDHSFAQIKPDYVVALHNLPGFGLNEIVLRDGVFAAASTGMIIELNGKTSHAAEPENGISPAKAVSRILRELPKIAEKDEFRHFTLATIIHAKIGEVAFGTSPGYGVVMATLRAFDSDEMEQLSRLASQLVKEIAFSERLEVSVSWTEKFPLTANDRRLNQIIGGTASRMGLKICYIEKAFKWSEDFGWFTQNHRGALFGIGAGEGHPELHNPDYDFPDGIIDTGVSILSSVCRELFKYQ